MFLLVIIIVILVLLGTINFFRRTAKCQTQGYIWGLSVLPATHMLPSTEKDLSLSTIQSSIAVTHCVLAPPHLPTWKVWKAISVRLLRDLNLELLTLEVVILTSWPHRRQW
jgi:hypothetical protein